MAFVGTLVLATACHEPSITAPGEDPNDDAAPPEVEVVDSAGRPDLDPLVERDTGHPALPPPESCGRAGLEGAPEACPLPKPYCYDERHLVVFSNGVCRAGRCEYTWSYFDCRLVDRFCAAGGCHTEAKLK